MTYGNVMNINQPCEHKGISFACNMTARTELQTIYFILLECDPIVWRDTAIIAMYCKNAGLGLKFN